MGIMSKPSVDPFIEEEVNEVDQLEETNNGRH